MASQPTPSSLLLSWAGSCAAVLALGLGCTPPEVRLPPIPSESDARSQATLQTRTLPLPREAVWAKVLPVLLDMGYQVRCASQDLGQVNIARTWSDTQQLLRPDITVEATLLLSPEGPGQTKVRMLASGSWSTVTKGEHPATVSGVTPALGAEDCRLFLDQLVERLQR